MNAIGIPEMPLLAASLSGIPFANGITFLIADHPAAMTNALPRGLFPRATAISRR
jgi:hypothetical protein